MVNKQKCLVRYACGSVTRWCDKVLLANMQSPSWVRQLFVDRIQFPTVVQILEVPVDQSLHFSFSIFLILWWECCCHSQLCVQSCSQCMWLEGILWKHCSPPFSQEDVFSTDFYSIGFLECTRITSCISSVLLSVSLVSST